MARGRIFNRQYRKVSLVVTETHIEEGGGVGFCSLQHWHRSRSLSITHVQKESHPTWAEFNGQYRTGRGGERGTHSGRGEGGSCGLQHSQIPR